MDKTFNPKDIEQQRYAHWESKGYFKASGAVKLLYTVTTPNVTGSLHMGHGFQQTTMDALTRYHRMKGNNTQGNAVPITRVLQRKWWLSVNLMHKTYSSRSRQRCLH